MKYLALLTPFLLGATASPVKERQTTAQANVSNFEAHTSASGAYIGYDLQIGDAIDTHCEFADTVSTTKLPNVPQVYCDDQAVRWQFNQDPSRPGSEGIYRIVIIYTSESPRITMAGYHEWMPADFPLNTIGTDYQGATEFSVDITA